MSITADTFEKTLEIMRRKLDKLVPDIEIKCKAELAYEINRLKKERGAIILGHNYMEPALYISVPDIVGDSLELITPLAHTTAISYVMKNGELYEGDTLNQVWPVERELPPFWWWAGEPTDRTGESYGYNGSDIFPDPDYTSVFGGTSSGLRLKVVDSRPLPGKWT